MSKTAGLSERASAQYRQLDATIQLAIRERVAHVIDEPMAYFRRGPSIGGDFPRLIDAIRIEDLEITVTMLFELTETQLMLIDIKIESAAPPEDE